MSSGRNDSSENFSPVTHGHSHVVVHRYGLSKHRRRNEWEDSDLDNALGWSDDEHSEGRDLSDVDLMSCSDEWEGLGQKGQEQRRSDIGDDLGDFDLIPCSEAGGDDVYWSQIARQCSSSPRPPPTDEDGDGGQDDGPHSSSPWPPSSFRSADGRSTSPILSTMSGLLDSDDVDHDLAASLHTFTSSPPNFTSDEGLSLEEGTAILK